MPGPLLEFRLLSRLDRDSAEARSGGGTTSGASRIRGALAMTGSASSSSGGGGGVQERGNSIIFAVTGALLMVVYGSVAGVTSERAEPCRCTFSDSDVASASTCQPRKSPKPAPDSKAEKASGRAGRSRKPVLAMLLILETQRSEG